MACLTKSELDQTSFVDDGKFTVTAEDFLDGLVVIFSDRQLEKVKETNTFKHFCDFLDNLSHGGKYLL